MFHVLHGVHLKSLQESMVVKTCKNFPKLNGPTLNSAAIIREERPDSRIGTTFTRSFREEFTFRERHDSKVQVKFSLILIARIERNRKFPPIFKITEFQFW